MSHTPGISVFVTGATGFLGRHTIAALQARNHRIVALVRPGTEPTFRENDTLRIVRGDLRAPDHLAPALKNIDVVIHLAAAVAGGADVQLQTAAVGTERLFQAIRGSSVRRVVLASSMSVYDWATARRELHDDSALAVAPGLYDRDGYAIAKVWQERVARAAAAAQNLELVVLRPGFLYGPGHEDCAGIGQRIGPAYMVFGPSRLLPLSYVENAAAAFAIAVDAPGTSGQPMLVLDRETISAWRYARLLIRHAKVRARFALPLPYWMARLLPLGAGLASRLLFGPGGKLPSLLLRPRFLPRFKPLGFAGSRLTTLLGGEAQPVSLQEALRRTFQLNSPVPPPENVSVADAALASRKPTAISAAPQ